MKTIKLFFLLIGICSLQIFRAQEGTLDTTFGTSGVLNFSTTINYTTATAKQPDGKILIAGYNYNKNAVICRLNPDGSFDTTFNGNGKIIYISDSYLQISKIVVLSDGKILFNTNSPNITKLNSDGSTDTTFGIDGSISSQGLLMQMQPDNKILVATGYDNGNCIVRRFNADGTTDPTFNSTGSQTVVMNSSYRFRLKELLVQPDHKILILGHSNGGASGDKGIVAKRLNENGSLDNTISLPVLPKSKAMQSAIFYSNAFYLSCSTDNSTSPDLEVFKFNLDGTLDTSFATNGTFATSFYNISENNNTVLNVQNDGKLLVASSVFVNNNSPIFFGLLRLDANGNLDSTFGTNGKTFVSTGYQTLNYLQPSQAVVFNDKFYIFSENSRICKFSLVNPILAVNTISQSEKITFYPNPAKDKINFSADIKEVKIFAANGQLLKTKFSTKELEVSSLLKGNYILVITDKSGNTSSHKLIKE